MRTSPLFSLALFATLSALAGACSDDAASADASRDSAATDSATLDSAGDSAQPDSTIRDSTVPRDTGSPDTGGPDCAVIGCGAPVACGETCGEACGCCGCSPTGGSCGTDGDGAAFATNCPSGCYQQTACGDTGCAVTDGVAVCGSCGTVELRYQGLTEGSAQSCTDDTDCHVLPGHCGVGLGGCYHIVNTDTTSSELAALAAMYVAASCPSAVCDCAAPPTGALCDAGTCVAS